MEKNKKFDLLLLSCFISNLFYALSYATIQVTIISQISTNLLSFKNLITSILTLLVVKLSTKFEYQAYKKYKSMLVLELLILFIITAMALMTKNIIMYFILDSLLYCTLAQAVICSTNKFYTKKYDENTRSLFDNNTIFYSNLASAIGYLIATLTTLTIDNAIILVFLALLFNNTCYLIEHNKLIQWR